MRGGSALITSLAHKHHEKLSDNFIHRYTFFPVIFSLVINETNAVMWLSLTLGMMRFRASA